MATPRLETESRASRGTPTTFPAESLYVEGFPGPTHGGKWREGTSRSKPRKSFPEGCSPTIFFWPIP